jgi:carbon-monoxide dehydrogenase medium subunit
MISAQFDFASPKSLEELHALLGNGAGNAILSGGYCLTALLKAEKLSPSLLISVGNISELNGITSNGDGSLSIGSATSLADIADHQIIKQQYPALIEAITLIGDRQYCHQTTIGDEYSYASFSMGLLSVLLAYGATFNYTDKHSHKSLTEPLAPQQDMILTTIDVPAGQGRSSYQEVKDPASYLPICGVASYLETNKDLVTLARFAFCGHGLPVKRLPAIEAAVIDSPTSQPINPSLFHPDFVEKPHSSSASNEYLAHLVHLLTSNSIDQKL